MTNRHIHRRSDGIAVICTGTSCAPSPRRALAWRALAVAAPIAVVAASVALGPRWLGIALAVLAAAAYLACEARALGPQVDATRAAPSRDAPWREEPAAAHPTSAVERG